MATALGDCRFVPGSNAKRFAHGIADRAATDNPTISEREAAYLRSCVYTFRRQIPRDVVSLAGDVLQQRRDYAALQAWRDGEVTNADGAAALMADGFRPPTATARPEPNLDLFAVARVIKE